MTAKQPNMEIPLGEASRSESSVRPTCKPHVDVMASGEGTPAGKTQCTPRVVGESIISVVLLPHRTQIKHCGLSF